jgi:prevent-host-death family protein
MITVGAFEAKTHLSSLLERVAQGEDVVITKRGRPIARLVAATAAGHQDIDAIIARIKALRAGQTLGRLSWKDLRDEGRR